MPWDAFKEDNEYCVYRVTDDEARKKMGKSLGCYPTEEKARKRIRALGYFAHRKSLEGVPESEREILAEQELAVVSTLLGGDWLTAEQVKAICPDCADHMAQRGLSKIKASTLKDVENLAKHIAKTCSDPGFFTCCMQHESVASYSEETRAAICARVHYEALGMWPGDKRNPKASKADEYDLGGTPLTAYMGGEIYVTLDGGTTFKRLKDAVAIKNLDGDRLMLLVTSNAYRDREKEIVRQKAWEHYVETSWKDAEFANPTPHLFWHAGEPLGEIIYADTEGPFLIEVAREGTGTIDLSKGEGELSPRQQQKRREALLEIFGTTGVIPVSKAWDALEQTDIPLGASPEFVYLKPDRADSVYERVIKTETSTLPRSAAGNEFTESQVIRRSSHD